MAGKIRREEVFLAGTAITPPQDLSPSVVELADPILSLPAGQTVQTEVRLRLPVGSLPGYYEGVLAAGVGSPAWQSVRLSRRCAGERPGEVAAVWQMRSISGRSAGYLLNIL